MNLTGKLGEHTTGTAEVARSNTDLQGAGTGERVDIRQDGTTLQAHLWGVRTQADFYNPNSLQSAGESQYGAKATYRLDERDSLVAESLKTSNSTTGAQQTGAELKVEHSLPGNAKLEVGLRHNRANAESVLSAPALPGPAHQFFAAKPKLPGRHASAACSSCGLGYRRGVDCQTKQTGGVWQYCRGLKPLILHCGEGLPVLGCGTRSTPNRLSERAVPNHRFSENDDAFRQQYAHDVTSGR